MVSSLGRRDRVSTFEVAGVSEADTLAVVEDLGLRPELARWIERLGRDN